MCFTVTVQGVPVSGFSHPMLPVVTMPEQSTPMQWGLIPGWIKDEAAAVDIAAKTLNARAETVFDKPSFRRAIVSRRALLPVDGFVEWRHEGKRTQPYVVRSVDRCEITLACIWETWTNMATGEDIPSFAILTTTANTLLQYVHNRKHRMPVVIPREQHNEWYTTTERGRLTQMMSPVPEGFLEAIPVSRGLTEAIGEAIR